MIRPQEQETISLKDRIISFLQRTRLVFLVILIAIAVGLIGFVVANEIRRGRVQESVAVVEDLQDRYDEWLDGLTADGAEADEPETTAGLREDLSELIATYPRLYAAQRARFLLGEMAFELEEWEDAALEYELLAEGFPRSHLAPIALANAAAAFEESGELERAIEFNRRVLDLEEDVPQKPRALFSLGRLHEELEDFENARTFYEDLLNDYAGSGWTNLARNRIIFFETQGTVDTNG